MFPNVVQQGRDAASDQRSLLDHLSHQVSEVFRVRPEGLLKPKRPSQTMPRIPFLCLVCDVRGGGLRTALLPVTRQTATTSSPRRGYCSPLSCYFPWLLASRARSGSSVPPGGPGTDEWLGQKSHSWPVSLRRHCGRAWLPLALDRKHADVIAAPSAPLSGLSFSVTHTKQ